MCMRLSSRAMLGCMVGLFLSASVGLFLTACYGLAQQPEQKQSPLPDGLRHVPHDAIGFVHLRIGDFLKSEIGKQIFTDLQQDGASKQGLERMEKEIDQVLGLRFADIDSVTLLVLSAPTLAEIQGADFRRFNTPPKKPVYDMPFKDFPKDMKKDFFEKKAIEKRLEDKFEQAKPTSNESFVQFQPGRFEQPIDEFHLHNEMQLMRLEHLARSGPLVIVTAAKPFDRKKVLQATVFPDNVRGGFPPSNGFLFLSDRSILFGNGWEVERYSAQMARSPGPKAKPMQPALALGNQPHTILAGGHLPVELRQSLLMNRGIAFDDMFRAILAVAPLMQAESALALDLGKNLDMTLQFTANTELQAEQLVQTAKNLRVLGELAIDKSNEAGEPGGWKLTLQKQIRQAFQDTAIEQKGLTVTARTKMPFDTTLVKRFTKEFVGNVRVKADRTQSIKNLKMIGLAIHGYHDANRRLPPAGITSINDPNGKPLLSWRVAILPYIEEGALYRQFDLTQPWDHPTNKKLIARMPSIYVVPGTENKNGLTHYRVLVGPQTMFELGQRITLVGVTDGTSNTIMAVEAKEPTEWTRPDDLPFDPRGALPKLGVTPDGFHALFGDATVRFIRAGMPPENLRAFITRNGGEVVNLPD